MCPRMIENEGLASPSPSPPRLSERASNHCLFCPGVDGGGEPLATKLRDSYCNCVLVLKQIFLFQIFDCNEGDRGTLETNTIHIHTQCENCAVTVVVVMQWTCHHQTKPVVARQMLAAVSLVLPQKLHTHHCFRAKIIYIWHRPRVRVL